MQREILNHTSLLGQEDIIRAIKSNDDLVLKHLYEKNYHKVEQFVLKNQGTQQHAKDIFQEAFIAMWNNVHADKFVPKGATALDGYLYSIARNKWKDYLRSGHFKKMVSENKEEGIQKKFVQEVEEENGEDPKMKKTLAAFSMLSAECKSLLTQFYFEKRSLKEIAEVFQIGNASLRNKKYRCMQSLRELAFNLNKKNG